MATTTGYEVIYCRLNSIALPLHVDDWIAPSLVLIDEIFIWAEGNF